MFRDIPWETVFILGATSLIQPLLNIAGLFDSIGPAGSIIVSTVIAVIWVGFAVSLRLNQPVLVLATAGAAYAVLSILLAVIKQIFFPGAAGEAPVSLPILLTAGLAGSVVMNIIWGAFLGLTSQVIMEVSKQ